jgi:argininosuccinate lyase
MQQKKNPDVAELIRGKTGRVYGDLVAILTMMKGMPLAYNKDMQEDKEALFDTVDTLKMCLQTFIPMLATLAFKKERMYKGAKKGFSNATDLADYLVTKGLGFRDAHHIVGNLVHYCLDQGKALEDLSLAEMKSNCPSEQDVASLIQEDVYAALKLENVVNRRKTYGGTAPEQVQEAVQRVKQCLKEMQKKLADN